MRVACGSLAKRSFNARRVTRRHRFGMQCPRNGFRTLDSSPGPHSPIGRGSGLKIRQVSVRVRLGALVTRRLCRCNRKVGD